MFEFVAKMMESSKFMAQLHCNRRLDIADCLTFSEAISCRIGSPHMFSHSDIKVKTYFFVISNLAVTKRTTINYPRSNFFLKLNWNRVLSLHLELKITFSLQYGQSPYIVWLSLVPKSSERLPKYGKTKVNSLVGNMTLRSFFDK